ncbi:unnamed protein product [Orchesella dallaii]|uniref:Uncharacterized protein n=1 Tax=Orchesella dallaii TaxID=48710 RepID=A0ABP1S4P2_9HEXA
MVDQQTGESPRPQNEWSVDKLAEKLQVEFYTLSSDNDKLQQEYNAYKKQAEGKLSKLYGKNARLRCEVHTSASAIHTIYQEMSEVLVQNRIIAGNNHQLVSEKIALENKLFEVKQSESSLQALVSTKSIEFSEEKEMLLGELSSMKISNEKLLLELNSRIKALEEEVQLMKTRNENLQHEIAILQKCDLDFILKKRAAITSRLRRKFCNRVNINNIENGTEKGKKIVLSELKTYGDGEFKHDVAKASENMEGPASSNLNNSIQQWSIWKGENNTGISDLFSAIQPFCASVSTATLVTGKSERIFGEANQVEIVTLSDSDS